MTTFRCLVWDAGTAAHQEVFPLPNDKQPQHVTGRMGGSSTSPKLNDLSNGDQYPYNNYGRQNKQRNNGNSFQTLHKNLEQSLIIR